MSPNMEDPVDYDLTCWYLNRRRIMERIGVDNFAMYLQGLDAYGSDGHLRELAEKAMFKSAVTDWLQREKPPTLGQLLTTGKAAAGKIFTYYSNWFCKGLSGHIAEDATADVRGLIYAKLDEFQEGWKIECRFHTEHLTGTSSWSELQGQKTLFVVGLITAVSDSVYEAVPFVIANPVPSLGQKASTMGRYWSSKFEIHVDGIDSFALVKNLRPSRSDTALEALRSIPEEAVKKAFSEIIGEPVVPKDWGGERSDLFSSHVVLEGKRISTALIFKGPSKFRPMTMAQLGKNGDQIDRLFSEPADLYVLQHCHAITPPVRGAMRAYAQQIGRLRLFCLIDGFDTLRILKAYKKCGLG